MLLSGVGLYGVVSYSVVLRRRELGVRLALGAQRTRVVSAVLRSALHLTCIGLAFGLAGAYAATRVLKSLLFDVSPLDPAALAVASACVLGIALL